MTLRKAAPLVLLFAVANGVAALSLGPGQRRAEGGNLMDLDGTRAELGGGRIALVGERLEFGTLFEDETPDVVLRVRNVGDEPLRILSIRPGCGCATVSPPVEPIPPGGESAAIPIHVSLGGMVGPYDKTGFVVTSDPTAPRVPFFMSGTVRRRFDIEPSALDLRPASPNTSARGEFQVVRHDGGNLEELVIDCPLQGLEARITSDKSKSRATVTITTPPVDEPVRTGIIIRIAEVERVVPLSVTPMREVECDPARLSTGLTARDSVYRVALRQTVEIDWKVLRVSSSRPDLLATHNGRTIDVWWSSSAPDGIVSGEIEIQLEGANPPRLRVPVTSFLVEADSGVPR